jgi:adenylate cyclase
MQYPGLPPLLSVAMTQHVAGDADPRFATYMGPIRFRSPTAGDRPVFDKIDRPAGRSGNPPLVADAIKGRYILIGGDFSDFDQFDTPFTRTGNPVTGETRMIGVEVHASMLAQLLDKALTLPPPVAIKVLAALLAVGLGAVTAAVRTRTLAAGAGGDRAIRPVPGAAIPDRAGGDGYAADARDGLARWLADRLYRDQRGAARHQRRTA